MNNIKIYCDNVELNYETFVFSGGEVQVKLDASNLKFFTLAQQITIQIIARIQNSEELFRLALIKDALINKGVPSSNLDLFLYYIPYARQDRICAEGEAFSLKVFTNFINSLNFAHVIVLDPHSDVSPALFNNVVVYSQLDVFRNWRELSNRVQKGCIFGSPDAGANKKTASVAKYFGHSEFIRADKLRDLSNGKILETIVYCDDLKGRDVMMIDDLCDGGATFILLAEALKKKNAGKVILYVSHGIFSKGMATLLRAGIDEIWTTDSFKLIYPERQIPEVHILELEKHFEFTK